MDSIRLLGMDVGSVAVSAVLINQQKEIIRTWYQFHQGDVRGLCRHILEASAADGATGLAVTKSTPSFIEAHHRCDNQMALIHGVSHRHGRPGAILVIGGERFGVLFFDEEGRYRNYRTNTSCAAGTGSFLDQQARRLKLSSSAELGRTAVQNQGPIPKIATRCAVFAKTDLAHAQQEGYSLPQICDGLCLGLARNVADTLFAKEKPQAPLILTGGVSQNPAVAGHLAAILGMDIITDGQAVHGALGAVLDFMSVRAEKTHRKNLPIHITDSPRQTCFYPRLELKRSAYPDFDQDHAYRFAPIDDTLADVEVTMYRRVSSDRPQSVWLGTDIGSTSTKAILIDIDGHPLAGFYTRTAGRPIRAMQNVLAAIEDYGRERRILLHIRDAAVTGAGRKLVGKVLGAHFIIDEITAHARAAWEIEPEVDTIIEIGGQDSKFTLIDHQSVTFSVMNTVCAAGTGSFIEELAERLGVSLAEYSDRALKARSPLVSDRCTVFMERDINHFLREGYTTDEMLAAVLHAICENYLTKVAVEGQIGRHVLFQGATAKNKALAAAFEQRLERPVLVSKFCHLTGAWGAALMLADQNAASGCFRGLGLHESPIPVRTEICDICANHCKITVADVAGETVAYGFLCGREYTDTRRQPADRSGFDLLKERQKVFDFKPQTPESSPAVIGLPAALYMVEDLPFWKKFFDRLGLRTITSENHTDAVQEGKHLSGAEFCSPMAALHGHVAWLAEQADFVFLPIYLEKKSDDKNLRRQYCYYSQYSAPLAATIDDRVEAKLVSPLVHYLYSGFHSRMQIYRALNKALPDRITWFKVSEAYLWAMQYFQEAQTRLKQVFSDAFGQGDGVEVVFLGRPYTVLSPSMNKGVPNIFARFGVKTFFQDMLEIPPDGQDDIKSLLEEVHWHYSAEILAAARRIAVTKGLYPVFITSFKCSPDSFIIEYFKKLMESHKKPYLILQLDEHDSNLGYETRIEAALRSFKNHHQKQSPGPARSAAPVLQARRVKILAGKTLFLPRWDDMTNDLMAANLRREGLDVRVLKPGESSLRQGLKVNTGQCIPLNIIAQEFIDNVNVQGLDPEKAVLWMVQSKLACNLALFPFHIKNILDNHRKGFEKSGLYAGYLSFADISVKLPLNTYMAIMFAGMIRKIGCRIRPYETQKGLTDQTIEKARALMIETFEGRRSKSQSVRRVVSLFENIETTGSQKPQVAVFGDLYVRDNEVMNQGLYHFIEDSGGEVITTPYHSYLKMIATAYLRKWIIERNYKEVVTSEALLVMVRQMEKAYLQVFSRILAEPEPKYDAPVKKILAEFGLRREHTGESMENLLKIHYLMQQHPDLALFVQASPAFCCPSLVTEAMNKRIEQKTGVPVVSITYDGTGARHNDTVAPYLMLAAERRKDALDLMKYAG